MFYLMHIFKWDAVFVVIIGTIVLVNAWDFGPWIFGPFLMLFTVLVAVAHIRQRRRGRS
jgi:hypothetical protein